MLKFECHSLSIRQTWSTVGSVMKLEDGIVGSGHLYHTLDSASSFFLVVITS